MHTADLHLNEKNVERWQALEEITRLAVTFDADLLLITGDLFDSSLAAEKMRADLRSLLGEASFKTIILPGNHDYKTYREGLNFGDTVSVLTQSTRPYDFGHLKVWGLPYQVQSREKTESQLLTLAGLMNEDEENILLYHGELLDAFFSRSDLGEEGDERYMPLSLSSFDGLPVRYVLAGHFHSRYARFPLPGGGSFVYPGSPVAITKKETGRRAVNLLEAQGAPAEHLLGSFHYEEFNLNLEPQSSLHPLKALEDKIKELHPAAKLMIKISGLFNGKALNLTEEELSAGIRLLAGEKLGAEPLEHYYDVRLVQEDDLFKKLTLKLEEKDLSVEEQERALKMAMEAFRVVKACS